ncbi:hypothetical protein QFC22_002157 [Naganishia vaughanmartiniae]|uniref:Uncharacterized protein n=1 Tax=Naganishia vaughanmartiniae TaxID=1424756 RepID=A0ACC2XBY9_9TREE|nr:hypothetical protein QFC22_002157 [Naganishia vaughanmartiniae]
MTQSQSAEQLAIEVRELSFTYTQGAEATRLTAEQTLEDIDLLLERGSRCLLIGANGSGKSTLLRILAGKKLTKTKCAKILGQDAFQHPPRSVVYLGTEWANNPVIKSDIGVAHFLDSVGGYRHPERRDMLLNLLDVDLDWRMHQISDGERRRVQLCMGLMGQWDVLLLDEVTVDLDVLVRSELLAFLIKESEERGATIVYATHIFDGLQSFPTHICHLQLGRTPTPLISWPIEKSSEVKHSHSDLLEIALEWLTEDRDLRRKMEKEKGKKSRGARSKTDTRDMKSFYEKYDYSAGK